MSQVLNRSESWIMPGFRIFIVVQGWPIFVNISGFWVFQACHYAQASKFPGLHRFVYFRKYDRGLNIRRNATKEGFWIFQNSEYFRFLRMQALRFRICLKNCSDYGRVMNMTGFIGCWTSSASKYARAPNMTRLWFCEGYSGLWICLDKPEYALVMSQYAWIWLNSAKYAWICQNSECVWCST